MGRGTSASADEVSVERAFRTFGWLWAIRWCSSIACDVFDAVVPRAPAGPFAHHVTASLTAVASALALAALAASKLPRIARVASGAGALLFALAAVPSLARVSADVVVAPAPAWAATSGDLVAFGDDHVTPLAGVFLALAVRGRVPRRLHLSLAAAAGFAFVLAPTMLLVLQVLARRDDRGLAFAALATFAGVWSSYECALVVLVVVTALVAAGDATPDARRRAGLVAWLAGGVYLLVVMAAALASLDVPELAELPHAFLVAAGAALVASAGATRTTTAAIAGASVTFLMKRFFVTAPVVVYEYATAYMWILGISFAVARVATAASLVHVARVEERRVLARLAVVGVVAGVVGLVEETRISVGGYIAYGALVVHTIVVVVVAYLLQRPLPVAEAPPAELSVGGVED